MDFVQQIITYTYRILLNACSLTHPVKFNVFIVAGTVNRVNAGNPDTSKDSAKLVQNPTFIIVSFFENLGSRVFKEGGRLPNVVIPGGVTKVVKLVCPDKSCKLVTFDEARRSRVSTEGGNIGNTVIPEGVAKVPKAVRPDNFGKLISFDEY